MKLFSLFFLVFSLSSFSQEIFRLRSEKEIIEMREKAIVQIVVFKGGSPFRTGTGFFVSKNHILTNYHTLSDFLNDNKDNNYKILVLDSDNRVITDLEIATCRDANMIDLCVFKTKFYKSANFFPVAQYRAGSEGQEVHILGRPDIGEPAKKYVYRIAKKWLNHKEYSGLKNILIESGNEKNFDLPSYQLDGVTEPGFSGSPAFSSSDGRLIGLSGDILREGKGNGDYVRYEMILPAEHLLGFLKKAKDFKEIDRDKIKIGYKSFTKSDDSINPEFRKFVPTLENMKKWKKK